MQYIRALFRSSKKFIGTDLAGNKYYETIRESGKPKREIITTLKPDEYEEIPTAWDAWLRHKRNNPPTHEELIAAEKRIETIRERGRILEEKDKQLRQNEIEEGLVAKPSPAATAVDQRGHAASAFSGTLDQSQDPVSTGTNFQPGSWAPGQATTTSKEKGKDSEEFEPESWSPTSKKN